MAGADGGAYLVERELPGLTREDNDVEVGDRELDITGELKESEREGVLRRSTRPTGRFEYRAPLPAEVKSDQVSASLTSVGHGAPPSTRATLKALGQFLRSSQIFP